MEHKKISILCPSRGRPEIFRRMVDSALNMGTGLSEILIYLDEDDQRRSAYPLTLVDDIIIGPSQRLGKIWNQLARFAKGDLLMMANDDLVFLTKDWDRHIIEIINASQFDDDIFVAWANDGAPNPTDRCTFPIVSCRWLELLGYLAPECFHFLYHDTWVGDIGKCLGRTLPIPNVVIEHRHFAFKKSNYDETYRRHREGRENVAKRREDESIFAETADERQRDADKLRHYMKEQKQPRNHVERTDTNEA